MQVYHTGSLTVVGFGGSPVHSKVDFSLSRVLTELVHRYVCRILAIDLAGVTTIPAGLPGCLVPIRKMVRTVRFTTRRIRSGTCSSRFRLNRCSTSAKRWPETSLLADLRLLLWRC